MMFGKKILLLVSAYLSLYMPVQALETLKTRKPIVTNNVIRVSFEATLRKDILANGFCFISTESFKNSIKGVSEGTKLKLIESLSFDPFKKVVGFSQYDSYCGLTVGSKVKANGTLTGKVSKKLRASVFLKTFQNKKEIAVKTDAVSCLRIHRVKNCFKTIDASLKQQEQENGTVLLQGAVNGLAGCFDLYERRGDLDKSIVVTLGKVPASFKNQSNTLAKNNLNGGSNKNCSERGFNEGEGAENES